MTGVLINKVPLDDDMRPAFAEDYRQSEDNASRQRIERLRAERARARGEGIDPNAAPSGEAPPAQQPAPELADSAPADVEGGIETPWYAQGTNEGLAGVEGEGIGNLVGNVGAVVGDIVHGGAEALPQMFGGFVDAIGEVDQFMQELVPLGGARLFDEDGNFSPALVDSQGMIDAEKAGNTIFDMVTTDKADSVTGGLIRSATQFMTGFLPAFSVARSAKMGSLAASFAGGAIADAVVFDPHETRLATFLNEVPALEAIIPDYLAETGEENQAGWEGRIKNAIEGAGLGVLTEGLFRAFKYYKAQRQLAPVGDEPGARGLALREEQDALAQAQIGTDVSDELLSPIGDPSPNAPLIIQGRADETLEIATKRVNRAEKRTAAYIERGEAMGRIKEIVDARAARDASKTFVVDETGEVVRLAPDQSRAPEGMRHVIGEDGRIRPVGENLLAEQQAAPKGASAAQAPQREAIDDALDELRSGAVSKSKFPARPVASIIRDLGGIDPTSSFAGDLRSRGITSRTFPGLFKKGGVGTLDNIPGTEHQLFLEQGRINADGYIDQQAFVDGLEAELRGDPWRTADQQTQIDEILAPAQDLEQQLSRLGIDYENMSNDAIKARVKAIEEEQAAEQAYIDGMLSRTDDGVPRSLDDLEVEQREIWSQEQIDEARSTGVSEEVIAQHQPPKVFINLARIDTDNDVRQLIQTLADADAAHIDAKGGGKRVSFDQMIKESDKEYKDVKDLIGRDPSSNMTRGQVIAANRLLVSSAEQVFELSKRATAPNAGKVDRYNFAKALSVHTAIQAEVIGAKREVARTLAAMRIPASADKFRTEAINEIINGIGGKNIDQVAHAVSMASNPQAAVNNIARQSLRKNIFDSAYQVFVNGILSGPQTHLVNMMSTSAVMMNNVAERYLARGISKAFYNGEVASGEAAAMAHGLVYGLRDAFKLVALGARSEQEKGLQVAFDAFVKNERPRQSAISSARYGVDPTGPLGKGIDSLGRLVDLPGNALEIEDRFMKTIAYRMELHAQSVRQASTEGLEGQAWRERVADLIENPPDDIRIEAIDQARIATFTNPLGKMGQQWQQSISGSPARWIMPFVRTPTNIVKYTFQRTPLAYASASIRADIAAGGARAAQAQARVALGTTMMLTMGGFAADGLITGGGPRDPKQNAAWRAAGNQPYSFKLGDKWVAYNRMDPLGMMIGLSADVVEIQTLSSEEDVSVLLAGGAVAMAQNLSSKTYMQGAVDFIDAWSGGNPASDVGQWAIRQTTSLVPYSSLIRQTARAIDPTTREVRDFQTDEDGKTDPVATMLNNMVNSHKRNIPWLSDTLPPVRDILGRPMDISTGGGMLADFMIPIRMKDIENDVLLNELVENEVKPSRISRAIGGIQLDAEQYDELQILAGEMVEQIVRPMVDDPSFRLMPSGPDSLKSNLLKSAMSTAHQAARAQFQERNPEFLEKMNNKRINTGNMLLGVE